MSVLCFEWVAAVSNRGPADEQMWVECGVESGAARKRMVHASLLLPSAARSYAYTERRCFARGNGAKSVAAGFWVAAVSAHFALDVRGGVDGLLCCCGRVVRRPGHT